MSDPYAPHNAFVDLARHAPEPRRLFMVIIAVELLLTFSPLAPTLLMSEVTVPAYFDGFTPAMVIAQLLSFAVTAAGLTLIVNRLHTRGFWSMVGPIGATLTNLRACLLGVGALMIVQIFLPPWIIMAEVETTRPIASWLFWAVVAFGAIVIQAGTEELYFRGYLQQQFAALSQNKLLWMGVPSLLFGAGHYMNGYGVADGLVYAFWASLLGLACADLTARTGNIGAAVGLHVANNMSAFLLVHVHCWPSSGLALFLYPYEDPHSYDYSLQALLSLGGLLDVIIAALMVLVMWLAARIAIAK